DGDYGVELRARVRTPEGLTDLRFVGVDGPRWMVRAVYQGAAAVDTSAAGPLSACLRGVVVERGSEAMPVREPLPLRLPRGVAEIMGDSPVRRFFRRFTASEAELEAEELQRDAAESGSTPCRDAHRGQMVSVTGRLRTVVYTPRTTLPTLEAELYDGSDLVT